jgi:Cdc6-like AAA superfamily ATPase
LDLAIKEKPLIKYDLQRNPFPNVGIPDQSDSVYTDRVEELRIIGDAIKGTMRGSSAHVVIVGSYGNGKTATLKFVKEQIERQIGQALAVYISNSGETFLEFYRNFMYEIGVDGLEEFAWSYLELICKIPRLKEKVNKGEILLPEVIENGKAHLHDDLRYTDFATAFLKFVLDETKFLSWKYLCGEPILFEQRKDLDVVSLIDTDEKALRALMSLKTLLNLIGYKMICILVDELESIELLHTFRKQRVLNSIRRLIDLNSSGLCLILACAPEAWNSIIRDYHAFSERIFREVVLKPLNNEIIRQFIADYLKRLRIAENESRSSIHPFTEDAVKQILVAAQGNLRRVLMICNRAVNQGAENGFPLLTAKKLKEMLPEIFENNV